MIELPARPSWMLHGACRGMSPDLFFPKRGGDWDTPLAVCARCTVTEECLEWALDNHEKAGIYGGTTERARRRIRKERRLEAGRADDTDEDDAA